MHSEYPLILEKKPEKPVSSYAAKSNSIGQLNPSNPNSSRKNTNTEQRPRNFKITKGRDPIKQSTTAEGFFKDGENQIDTEPTKSITITAKRETPKKTNFTPEQIPKSTASSVLMTRHFLHEDVILIFEDVVQLNKQMYHCCLTKPH